MRRRLGRFEPDRMVRCRRRTAPWRSTMACRSVLRGRPPQRRCQSPTGQRSTTKPCYKRLDRFANECGGSRLRGCWKKWRWRRAAWFTSALLRAHDPSMRTVMQWRWRRSSDAPAIVSGLPKKIGTIQRSKKLQVNSLPMVTQQLSEVGALRGVGARQHGLFCRQFPPTREHHRKRSDNDYNISLIRKFSPTSRPLQNYI